MSSRRCLCPGRSGTTGEEKRKAKKNPEFFPRLQHPDTHPVNPKTPPCHGLQHPWGMELIICPVAGFWGGAMEMMLSVQKGDLHPA